MKHTTYTCDFCKKKISTYKDRRTFQSSEIDMALLALSEVYMHDVCLSKYKNIKFEIKNGIRKLYNKVRKEQLDED